MEHARERDGVVRAKHGAAAAWVEFIAGIQSPLLLFARSRIGDYDEAKDIVAETVLRASVLLPGYESEAHARSSMYRIARNLCIDWLRDRQRHPNVSLDACQSEDPESGALEVADPALEPLAELIRREAAAKVRQALRALRSTHRDYYTALYLSYYEGMANTEIAQILGVPPGTVGTWKYRGHQLLRTILEGG
jgi:RNA polymerase sigma-70 factor (ECF subfamily)